MSVPDFQSFMLPVLNRCAGGQEHSLEWFRTHIADDMGISPGDVEGDMLPSTWPLSHQIDPLS